MGFLGLILRKLANLSVKRKKGIIEKVKLINMQDKLMNWSISYTD